MTTFKATVKKPRSDGFYTVYIRVTHQRKTSYIKTNKIIDPAHITSSGELTDPVVNEYCAIIIRQYTDKLNRVDATFWELKDVIEFLHKNDEETCFSDYARKFISKMESEGHERNAKNYKLAVNHLERYIGTTKIMFSILTTSVLTQWIDTLYKTSRAKEMYPTCIRQIFKKAIIELNDEERGILRIKYNPWLKIIIPKSDNTLKRAISAEACREFFNRPLPQSKMVSPLPELGRDIALLSLCMGGKQYAAFQAKLTPGVPVESFIGIRVPVLRKFAKEFTKEAECKDFLQQLPHEYYDENMLHGLLISEVKDYEECIRLTDRFLPFVDNWAVCDIMSPKVFAKHKKELLAKIKTWSKSSHVYTCRFGIETLMSHYLDKDFKAEYLEIPASVRSEEYYVKMMVAWFFATALAKQWDATIPYIEQNRLAPWTHNKTIQKAIESYRITPEQKEYMRTLKIK